MAVEILTDHADHEVTDLQKDSSTQEYPLEIGRITTFNGSCQTEEIFIQGYNENVAGLPHKGLTGPETSIIRVRVFPVKTFMVLDKDK